MYSEKATKFCEIFPILLTLCTVVKSKGKISQNFVAFSEYMNFTWDILSSIRFPFVVLYILRRPQNFAKSSPYFWLQYIKSKVRGRFRKILRPSQNIWTLLGVYCCYLGKRKNFVYIWYSIYLLSKKDFFWFGSNWYHFTFEVIWQSLTQIAQ